MYISESNALLALICEALAMQRGLTCLLILTLLAGPTWAEGKAKKPEPGTTVEMPYLMAPMSQGGKLLGYAYISSKLICSSPSACITVREKLAFIQDGFVREVNAKPISLADDPTAVDRDLLNSRLTAKAKQIVGERKVVNMVFLQVQFAPLHPSESTTGQTNPQQPMPATGRNGEAGQGAASAEGTGQPAGGSTPQPAATSKPPAKQAQ
jgi:hypothetical protein